MTNATIPPPTAARVHSTEAPGAYHPAPPQGLRAATIAFVLVYWLLFGFLLQDVDLSQAPRWWQLQVSAFPLLGFIPVQMIAFISHALSPWVWRHVLIPGAVGWWLAGEVATGFLRQFYAFPDRGAAATFLRALQQYGGAPARATTSAAAVPPARPAPTRMVVNLTLITLPFALIFLLLLAMTLLFTPPILSNSIKNVIVVVLAGVWAVVVAGYLLGQFNSQPTPPRGLRLEREALRDMRQQHALLRVGGPGRLLIDGSDAAVTEYDGRFSRVLGPGASTLRPFEYVRAMVDLRPQERVDDVTAITRDGVAVTAEIALSFRISSDDRFFDGDEVLTAPPPEEARRPTRDNLYPFGEHAVRAAAYAETVVEEKRRLMWMSLPLLVATHQFQNALGQQNLDSLFDPDVDGHAPAAHAALQEQVSRETRRVLRRFGIHLVTMHLGRLRAPEAVTAQTIEGWRAYWQQEAEAQAADSAGSARAHARHEAAALLLRAIVDGVASAQQETVDTAPPLDEVAAHLLAAMEGAARALEEVDQENSVAQRLDRWRQRLVAPPADSDIDPS